MKKINLIIIISLLVVLAVFYFINSRKNNSLDINYEEPNTSFFNKNEIPVGAILVKIGENEFTPENIEIKKGDTVVWVNDSDGYAWPASDPHPTHTNYSSGAPFFDPELPMKENEAWAFTFDKTGSWKYHDHLDPTKRGIVHVLD